MFLRKFFCIWITVSFTATSIVPPQKSYAQGVLGLPEPGAMVSLSPAYEPVMIKGLTVHKDNPFLFDFIVDVGQDKVSGEPLKEEGTKLIKYFLASLAIPDKDVWVNLSPYEKDRMIPEALGQTDMGRDLLAQDYILKQLTASLIYPEKQLGKSFWTKVYAKAQAMYGTTEIPVNTFNKVWIMADKAEVFERNQTAFVVGQHLKVMLEEDYLALNKQMPISQDKPVNTIANQIVREIVLPELEKEVNAGKNFANLRQIFNSIILSSWYKRNLKDTLLNQLYADKAKVKGIDLNDPTVKQQIYEQYLKAYKKGVFNYIKEDVNAANGQSMPRKYFSGGITKAGAALNPTMSHDPAALAAIPEGNRLVDFATVAEPHKSKPLNAAMTIQSETLTKQQPYGQSFKPELKKEYRLKITLKSKAGEEDSKTFIFKMKKLKAIEIAQEIEGEQPVFTTLGEAGLYTIQLKDGSNSKRKQHKEEPAVAIRWNSQDEIKLIRMGGIESSANIKYILEGDGNGAEVKAEGNPRAIQQNLQSATVVLYQQKRNAPSLRIQEGELSSNKEFPLDVTGQEAKDLSLTLRSLASEGPEKEFDSQMIKVKIVTAENISINGKWYRKNVRYPVKLKDEHGIEKSGVSIFWDGNNKIQLRKTRDMDWVMVRFKFEEIAQEVQARDKIEDNPDAAMKALVLGNEKIEMSSREAVLEGLNAWSKKGLFVKNLIFLPPGEENTPGEMSIMEKGTNVGYVVDWMDPEAIIKILKDQFSVKGITTINIYSPKDFGALLGIQPGKTQIKLIFYSRDGKVSHPELPSLDQVLTYQAPHLQDVLMVSANDGRVYEIPHVYIKAITIVDTSTDKPNPDQAMLTRGGYTKKMIKALNEHGRDNIVYLIDKVEPADLRPRLQIYFNDPIVNIQSIADLVAHDPITLNHKFHEARRLELNEEEMDSIKSALTENFGLRFRKSSDDIIGFPIQYFWKTNETKSAQVLMDHKIYTIGQLFQKSRPELKKIGLKDIQIDKIEGKLKELGLDLADAAMETVDKAALALSPGGIDLATSGMNWKISKDGKGVEMNIDPAMIERIRREGIDSLSPIILRITPIASIWPLVGLKDPEDETKLAKI